MLLVGSDDGVYRVNDVLESPELDAEQTLESGQVVRIHPFEGIDGVFAATTTGLYHSLDGETWTNVGVPREQVYAVGASPDGERIYAGTRPAHLYRARIDGTARPDDGLAWQSLDGFRERGERDGWGIDRHENVAQVRDVRVHPAAPERVVAGVEVGGVYVSDDGSDEWRDGRVRSFDAPHTDDVHHLCLAGPETVVAATGSGLYRSTDVGRTWSRLDADHRQSYFRESVAHEGTLFAGGSPTPPSSWEDDRDHALFRTPGGQSLEPVPSPTPGEVAVGWTVADGDLLGVTHRGTLLVRSAGGWETLGSVPAPRSVHGRCIPLAWWEPRGRTRSR